jgi:hypothetical protein
LWNFSICIQKYKDERGSVIAKVNNSWNNFVSHMQAISSTVNESCTTWRHPTQRSQDTDSVLSGKMMAGHFDWVHLTLGILAPFQAFSYASAFFQSDGVPPPDPARVTQTLRSL